MSSVDFIFEGKPLTIQCNEKDKMDEIIKKFCEKINKNKDEIYFIYGGNFVKENKSFTQIASSDDIKRYLMNHQKNQKFVLKNLNI